MESYHPCEILDETLLSIIQPLLASVLSLKAVDYNLLPVCLH